MKTPHTPSAKILVHSEGLGVPSAETVRERAAELAKINGHAEITDNDWQQAKIELHGGHSEASSDGDNEQIQSVSERDMIATDHGHRVHKMGDDTENAVEELFAEGLDEAVHDQMLQASQAEADEQAE
ncbi:MAG: hypothetical protein QOD99_1735 [Chthoniobacter sp.]|nr:hypothetical protein [Chthoniobacter sp.]